MEGIYSSEVDGKIVTFTFDDVQRYLEWVTPSILTEPFFWSKSQINALQEHLGDSANLKEVAEAIIAWRTATHTTPPAS